jgi:ATP-dependent Lon protease
MAKFSSSKQSKKDSVEQGSAPARKKPMSKKRGGGAQGDDDESVDSRGNIRGLLAYEDEESWDEEEEDTPSDLTRKSERERRMMSTRSSKKKAESQKKKKAVQKVVESDDSSSEEEVAPRKRRGFAPKRRLIKEEEEEDEEEEDEEEDEDEDEEEEDEEDEDEEDERHGGLLISFDTGEQSENRMIPKRHNMKKESANVKKFVELVTKPHVEGGIDEQIDEFKRLSAEKQNELLVTLDRKVTADSKSQSMMFRILDMKLTPDTQSMVLAKYNALQAMDPGSGEYFKQRAWLEKFASIPLGVYKEIPVKISDGTDTCGAFMERARKYLGEAIYGQNEAKIQILQFIASKIANPDGRGLSLLLAGPPGIGKTSLIKNGVAKALQWPFQFISLGGDSDASSYVGHQVVYEGSHCGKIVNSVIGAKSMSMVLMFDELDKISATAKGEEIQNLLVHLTDPVQNADFEDKYLSGIPIDLSKVLFTFSANDLSRIDRVLMDRMVVIELNGYSTKEKLAIAESFLLPSALKEVNLDEKVHISHEVLEHIISGYAGEEKGVRELKRSIDGIVQKINMLRIFNTKDLPFHIPDFHLPFMVKKSHVDLFLKKKQVDTSLARLYT